VGVSVLQYIGLLLSSLLQGSATEAAVKAEYPTVYEILDYAVDFGFPLLDESNTILTLLTRPPTDYAKGIRQQLDLQRPWCMVGISHSANEIFIDIVETVDVTVSQCGRLEFCHIRGSVNVMSKLSETPACRLVLTPSSRWEDVAFHRCAENESPDARVIPFVPPDGPFTLLRYRITATQSNIPLFVAPKFHWSRGGVSFDITFRSDASIPKALDQVELRFELPEGVNQPSLSPSVGTARWEGKEREVVWTVGVYSKKEAGQLRGSATTESKFDIGGRFPVVTARFITTGAAASGFMVVHLDVSYVPYKAFKGVKYVIQSGNYEFRTGLS
jgi:AP-3 complex subunit mu